MPRAAEDHDPVIDERNRAHIRKFPRRCQPAHDHIDLAGLKPFHQFVIRAFDQRNAQLRRASKHFGGGFGHDVRGHRRQASDGEAAFGAAAKLRDILQRVPHLREHELGAREQRASARSRDEAPRGQVVKQRYAQQMLRFPQALVDRVPRNAQPSRRGLD